MVLNTNNILDDVTGIVASVKPYMFEEGSAAAPQPDNPSASSTEIDTFGILSASVNDEPDEEEVGKTDPELDTYIGAYVKELAAAVAAGDKEGGTCVCPPH
jgi:hypothetical protein